MVRDRDAERIFIGRKFRPARKDGLLLLVDRDDDGTEEKVTSAGLIIKTPIGDLRRATVIGCGEYVKDVISGDRVLVHKAYGLRIDHGFDPSYKLILVTWNQIEVAIEDETCVD